MQKYFFVIISSAAALVTAAGPTTQGVLPPSDIPRFENADKAIAKPETRKTEVAESVNVPPQKDNTVEIGEHDLRKNPELTVQLIEQSLRSQNWALLADLLPLYRSLPQYDEILYDYANGALLRSQKKHGEAIAAYRRIIAKDPDLSYVRLDLAGMLYENKQYQASKDQFERVKADEITQEARMMADVYLMRIQKQQGWVVNAGVQYERNDNVNNASSIRHVDTSLGRLERNEDSLPKKANGLRYNFSAERDWNIAGNHYLTTEASFDGVHYWDNKDYSEQSVHLGTGYKNQNIQQWTSVSPFIGYHRLGGEAYSRNFGISTQHGRWLNDNWQVVGAFTHLQRRYAKSYLSERYNGHLNNLSVTAAWLPQAGLMIYSGADYGRERAAESQESSKRKGLRTGVLKEWQNGLSTRVNLRYTHRNFDAPNQYFGIVRRDKEYQANFAIWHRSVHLYGITPKLNFQYLKVKSNIPAFYSRQNKQWFITLEKTF